MKKLMYTVALLGLAGTVQAQPRVALGLKAGASYTSLTGDDLQADASLLGFHVGGFATLRLSELLAFQPEILYSQKGSKRTLSKQYGGQDNEEKFRLHYVDIPLTLRVKAGGLFFEAGPQVGLLLSARTELPGADGTVTDAFRPVELGYLAGLGYQSEAGPGIGLRYNGGLRSIYKASDVTDDFTAYNSAFQLYLSYAFTGR